MLPFLACLLWLAPATLGAIYRRSDSLPDVTFDFIIVGGGTAGSVLANRLTEIPQFQVLVIEAGPDNEGVFDLMVPGFVFNIANSAFDWNFTTTPQKGLNDRIITFERGHGLGGSSSVNGMIYTRGSSSDYDRFARVTGEPTWSWDALQPYVRKHESFTPPVDGHNTTNEFDPRVHGSNGPILTTLPALLNPSIDSRMLATANQLKGWQQATAGHGERSSAATGYLSAAVRARPNLHILLETRVTRILKSSGPGMALRTVEFTSGTGLSSPRTILTATKEVILSAGSIMTPHILLHSGIGDQRTVSKLGIDSILDLPGVGMNLTEHPFFAVTFDLNITDDTDPWGEVFIDPTVTNEAIALWNATRGGPLATIGRLDQIVWARVPPSIFNANVPDPSSGSNSAHYEMGISGTATSLISGSSIVSPASRGTVSINSSNPFDPPLIDPGLFTNELDLTMARESIRALFRFVAAPAWKDVLIGPTAPLVNNPTDEFLNDFLRNTSFANLHPTGTAMMSPANAPWGVVNPDLLLKKASGLRIIDASVYPFVPCAHTSASVYIISERAADVVKAAWGVL